MGQIEVLFSRSCPDLVVSVRLDKLVGIDATRKSRVISPARGAVEVLKLWVTATVDCVG